MYFLSKNTVLIFLVCALNFLNVSSAEEAKKETTTETIIVNDIETAENSTSQYLDDYIDKYLRNGTILSDDIEDEPEDGENAGAVDGENTGAEDGELFLPGLFKCKCGVSNPPQRIVNGKESALGTWPWMAAIVYADPENVNTPTNRYQGICGGSIINDQYILTAAHCTAVMRQIGIKKFKIILGDININGVPSSTRKLFDVIALKRHPKYNNETFNYDVALVKLNATITYNNNIRPICLGQAGSPYANRNSTVAGWGLTRGGNTDSQSNSLRETTLTVLANSDCKRIFNDADYTPMTKICAYNRGSIACNGDSGGPLVIRRQSNSLIYKQIGIVSYGLSENCGLQTPDVYTRVKRVLAWIRGATRDAAYCGNSFTP